ENVEKVYAIGNARNKKMRVDRTLFYNFNNHFYERQQAAQTLMNMSSDSEPVELAYDTEEDDLPHTPRSENSLVLLDKRPKEKVYFANNNNESKVFAASTYADVKGQD